MDSRAKTGSSTLIIAEPPQASERTQAILFVLGGSETGRVFPIPVGPPVTLGRADTCTFRFDDASVSGQHANVTRVLNMYVFVDDGSRNGSYVNGARVERPTKLQDGDRIQLGSSTFLRFSIVDESEKGALIKMYEAASRDALTGAYNRKHLQERLHAEFAFALRHGSELSVAMFDVDHFKRVNDTHGHLAGDEVLKSTANILAQGIRAEDFLARYGGEEFIIVARGVNAKGTTILAERLRQAVERSVVMFQGTEIRVTASSGVASIQCLGENRDVASLVGLADSRLYEAKRGGRNRVIGPS